MQQIAEYSEYDYYNSAVIRPPKDFKYFEADTRHTRIVVDSRVRDKKLFPNQNNYEVQLDDDINDVREARLLNIQVPMPMYIVNAYFDKIYFNVGASQYTATVEIGDYGPTGLATAIENAMNAETPSTFSVTYNSRLDNFEIRSTVDFSLLFGSVSGEAWIEKPGNLGLLLGFNTQKNYASSVEASVPGFPFLLRSEYRSNFDYNNYLILDIEQFDVLKSIDRDLNKSFAVIPKEYSIMNVSDEANIVKTFNPPIARLAKLRVKFYDRFGNPYDFQNMDHRFEMLVTSFKQRRKYNV